MKKILLGLLVVGLVSGGAVLRYRTNVSSAPAQFAVDPRRATPESCVSTYFQALKAGNEDAYLNCLSHGLRAGQRQRYTSPGALGKDLLAQGKDLRAWVVFGQERGEGNIIAVWVDQQFSGCCKRQKIHLQPEGSSWEIIFLEPARDLPQEVPFGTHVSKVPDRNEREIPEEPEP